MRPLLLALVMLAVVAGGCTRRPETAPAFDAAAVLADADTSGFARADRPHDFRFPADHGPHPDFRTEWWYFTGNVHTPDGRRFGYELAIFRQALAPTSAPRGSRFATRQAYMAHFALTDVARGQFHAFERFARGANGLAGARARPFRVWVEDWSVEGTEFPWRIRAADGAVQIDLALAPHKPVVLQGDRGLSRKGAQPGNASYYYSYTRLDTHGTITTPEGEFAVRGDSWMDREWSTSALERAQAGWDWFGLQLSDGSELMYYRLRHRDGSASPFSQGTRVDAAGNVQSLRHDDVTLETLDTWTSPRGGQYPARVRLTVKPDLVVEVRPLLADQELDVAVRYWEGAVSVQGTRAGKPLEGKGYMELTGYARPAAR